MDQTQAARAIDVLDGMGYTYDEESGYLPPRPTSQSDSQHLGNLLARIHRDGGHYQQEHGTEKAVQDADEIVANLNALKDSIPAQAGVPDGYVLALQTAVNMPDGKKELGYTLLSDVGIFTSHEDVSAAIAELSLPLGWVSMTTSQLLPGWACTAADPSTPSTLSQQVAAAQAEVAGWSDDKRASVQLEGAASVDGEIRSTLPLIEKE